MRYVKVAKTSDIGPGSKIKITAEGKVILVANLNGTYYAIDNTCPHMGGSLSDGRLEGTNIICPRHGSVFDITTGKAVKDGKLLFFTAKVHDLQRYPVKLDGADVFIGIE